jgi:hypothetical protein
MVVSSPTIWWPSDGQATFSLEQTLFNTTKILPVNLYMTIGSAETATMISDFYKMSDTLVSRQYKSFNFKYKLDEGQSHTSNSNVTFSEGITWILNQPLPAIPTNNIEIENTPILTYTVSRGFLTIDFKDSGLQNARVDLWNILGQLMYSKIAETSIVNIDVSGMKKGIYIVTISTKTKRSLLKMILQ